MRRWSDKDLPCCTFCDKKHLGVFHGNRIWPKAARLRWWEIWHHATCQSESQFARSKEWRSKNAELCQHSIFKNAFRIISQFVENGTGKITNQGFTGDHQQSPFSRTKLTLSLLLFVNCLGKSTRMHSPAFSKFSLILNYRRTKCTSVQ